MNNFQIEAFCKRDPVLRDKFMGIYASDSYPYLGNNTFIIVNTLTLKQAESRIGHWIALCKINNQVELFDSSNTVSDFYYDLRNNKIIQPSDSTICGELCCLYVYYRFRGYSMGNVCEYLVNKVNK